jgi:hypothetical protein
MLAYLATTILRGNVPDEEAYTMPFPLPVLPAAVASALVARLLWYGIGEQRR